MAPTDTPIDYQALIHSNCLTFLGYDVDVYINSQVDDSGTWTAHVLKVENGKRSAVFSESSTTLASALEAVHKKSAMAVNRFVTTNGFDLVPKISLRRSTLRKSRNARRAVLEESEVLTFDSGSSSSNEEDEDSPSDSDESIDDSPHGQALQRSTGRVMVRSRMPVRRPEPLANGLPFHGNYYERVLDTAARPPPVPYVPYHPVGLPPARPLPPPSAIGKAMSPPVLHPARPPPRPAPIPAPAHRAHGLPPRPETRLLTEPAKTGVLLCITWKGHGDLNVVDECPLSISYIHIRTVQLVRARAADFQDTASVDLAAVVFQAQIKRLHVAGKAYELGNFRDNLVELFAGFPDFPRVEVEVTSAPAPLATEPTSQNHSQSPK